MAAARIVDRSDVGSAENSARDAVHAVSEIPGVGVITAVIVHRSRPKSCVCTGRALLAQAAEVGVTLRLVVADNGSSPEEVAELRAGLPSAVILELGTNTGFGPGANAGLRHFLAGDPADLGEWVVICPHDASPEDRCLERLLVGVSTREGAGLASAEYGMRSDDTSTIDRSRGGVANPTRPRVHQKVKPMVHRYCGSYLVASSCEPGWEDADYPHGTLMVAARACLEDIGLFDERYFAYCEEADLGERARRAGWQVGVIWGAVVANPTMSSEVGVPEYLMVRNTLWLVHRYFGAHRAAVLLALTAWITLVGAVFPSRQTPYWHLRGRLLAMRDFVLGRSGPPPRWW